MSHLLLDPMLEKGENIIDTVSDNEMQNFFIWLQENDKLDNQFLSRGFFEFIYIQNELLKFRAEKKAS
jgi:hypothetical protein